MSISDGTIALAIPSALKSDHPDSALVVQALAVALAACEDSGAMTAKGRMRDVHAALSSVYVPIFQAHITKEDEDWNALKAKADRYRPTVDVAVRRERSEFAQYILSGEVNGTGFAEKVGDQWAAELMTADGWQSQKAFGDSARSAMTQLLDEMGYMVAWKAQEPTGETSPL